MKLASFILSLHAAFLRLYPRCFRDEFADEMHAVFAAILADASERGTRLAVSVCLQEFAGLLACLVVQHWLNLCRLGREGSLAVSMLGAKLSQTFRSRDIFPFVLGIVLLASIWLVIYILEMFFAESHLAAYYCCLMPDELAAIGPTERAISDFFRTTPGRYLPGLVFLSANIVLFARSLRRASSVAWLPLTFVLFNVLYVIASIVLVSLSNEISTWIVGPQTTPYRGYSRTWYGIVLHLALWAAFFGAMLRAKWVAGAAQPASV